MRRLTRSGAPSSRLCRGAGFLLLFLLPMTGIGVGQGSPPPGRATFFSLDLQGTAPDEFPGSVKALNGVMTVVDRNGQHMLKASSPSEFLITLPQVLPADFTVELDFIPKGCCAPDDIMLEGTPTRNRGVASAELTWHPERISAVGGGGEMYQSAMPADLAASTPGSLTHVVVEFRGPTIKLYTNGRRLYTLEKQFARGRVLRVWLGGGSESNPMYLAGLRIGAGAMSTTVAGSNLPGAAPAPDSPAPSKLTGNPLPVVSADPSAPTTEPAAGTQTASQSFAATARTSVTDPSAVSSSAPVGAGSPPEPALAQDAGTPGSMRIEKTAFDMILLKGGSASGGVVETRLADGSIKKQLGDVQVEPFVFDVSLGSPVDKWLRSLLSGADSVKNGALFGGVIPSQQQLDFQNGQLGSVTVPTLDASTTTPAYLRVTVIPETVTLNALSGGGALRLPGWTSSGFRFSMDNLETRRTSRIESFRIASALAPVAIGEKRAYTTSSPGRPSIPNLFVTFMDDATRPATNWLTWYDDFVIKGNNDDSHEKSFTLELGGSLLTGGAAPLTLKGSGVGIIALRTLPSPAGSTARRLQAELYVERMEVVP